MVEILYYNGKKFGNGIDHYYITANGKVFDCVMSGRTCFSVYDITDWVSENSNGIAYKKKDCVPIEYDKLPEILMAFLEVGKEVLSE